MSRVGWPVVRPGLWLAALVALLAGCTSRPAREVAPPIDAAAAAQAEQLRETRLAAYPAWSFTGRVAISSGKQGGSGSIEWSQQGDQYVVSLSAPITRQGWRLSGDAESATLEGLEGGTRHGDDPAALLKTATGWDIPVRELAGWVRGSGIPEADRTLGPDGHTAAASRSGWSLAFSQWTEVPASPPIAMPTRIDAARGEARIRLVVDEWTLPARSP